MFTLVRTPIETTFPDTASRIGGVSKPPTKSMHMATWPQLSRARAPLCLFSEYETERVLISNLSKIGRILSKRLKELDGASGCADVDLCLLMAAGLCLLSLVLSRD